MATAANPGRFPGRGSWLDGCASLVILLPSPQLAQHPVGPPLLPSPHDDPLLDPRVADSRPVLRCLGHFRPLQLAHEPTGVHDVLDHFSFEKRMLRGVTGGVGIKPGAVRLRNACRQPCAEEAKRAADHRRLSLGGRSTPRLSAAAHAAAPAAWRSSPSSAAPRRASADLVAKRCDAAICPESREKRKCAACA
jgi:hypothetical protein